MDSKSHELFAEILLKSINSNISSQWGTAPDIDISFLHRWYRHRISIIQKTYNEFPKWKNNELLNTQDKDGVTLCIVSHLYLDIFNGWVYPFGFWHIITPEKTVINELLSDIDKPKIFVKVLNTLIGSEPYIQQFYADSKKLMERFIISDITIEKLIGLFVYRLSTYTTNYDFTRKHLYIKAMNQISEFTGNNKYKQGNIYLSQTNDIFLQFETSYCSLIEKALDSYNNRGDDIKDESKQTIR